MSQDPSNDTNAAALFENTAAALRQDRPDPSTAVTIANRALDELRGGPTDGSTPERKPLSEWRDATRPDPVIWYENDDRTRSPLVSVGEVGILSAPGGSGKSYLALQLAIAAAQASGDVVETDIGY